jgi:predicted MFS family arabinose efflux permease
MTASILLPGTRRGTVPVMAVACGVMVGNIYLCQPLLAQIAEGFGVPESASSLVAVATQIGYAFGILMVVPLADMAQPSRLMRWLLALTALAMAAAATAPNLPLLLVACLCFAPVTVVAQILIPLSTSLARPEHRGRIVGSLQTGLVLGILLSRTFSGITAEMAGSWRASYALAAALTAVLFFILPSFVPAKRENLATTRYRDLMGSMPAMLRHRPLLLSMGMNFFAFGAFTGLWSMLAFHLQTPAFGLGPAAAGLFGLWGAPGVMLSPMAGRLSDRWGPARVNALAFGFAALGFLVAGTWGAASVAGLVIAVNLTDFGVQSGQVANQTRIFALGAEIRGRLNTLYMTATFFGGALGAFAAGLAWTAAGWTGVCLLCGGLIGIAALLLLASEIGGRRPA